MTVGEIIKEYTIEHSMKEFTKNSGLSRAYAYMLINNRNNKGEPITPSMDTIQQVANGIGKPIGDVLDILDQDCIVKVRPKVAKRNANEEEVISSLRNRLDQVPPKDTISEHDRHILFCYHLLSDEMRETVDDILNKAYHRHLEDQKKANEENSAS